jgi:chromosome segregation ATPase
MLFYCLDSTADKKKGREEMSADKLEARVSDLEQYFKMLVEMLRRHDERLDEVRAEQSDADRRIAALADAQIHAEETQSNADRRIAALADAQIHAGEVQSNADRRIAALADAQIRTDKAITRLSGRVDQLTENVDRVTGRVDRLAETVDRYIEGRNGQG